LNKNPQVYPQIAFSLSLLGDFEISSIPPSLDSQDEEPFTLEDLTGLPSRSSKVSLGLVAPGSVLKDVWGAGTIRNGRYRLFYTKKTGMVVIN